MFLSFKKYELRELYFNFKSMSIKLYTTLELALSNNPVYLVIKYSSPTIGGQ